MTEQSQFFSDGTYYSQNVFSRVWKDIFGQNGVFDGIDDELAVVPISPVGMAVKVSTGRSFVQGYFHEILDDPVQLTISAADTTNDRIDRIVLRLDVDTNRKIAVAVLQGTPAASPVAPTLTQTDSIYEISLAQIAVAANATSIVAGNITDERTYATYKRDNMPLASKTAFGAVKVGGGITVADGVISVSNGAYPSLARLYTTDTTYGTLIVANVYNGTVGQLPTGLILQNPSDEHTVTYSASARFATNSSASAYATGYVAIYARNTTDGTTRLVENTTSYTRGAVGSGYEYHTWTGTIAIKMNEIIYGTAVATSVAEGSSVDSGSASSSDNNVWLGSPI